MSGSSDARAQLGRTGERLAEDFLRRQGLKLVARRFNTPVGELDLVMCDRDAVVFVEVKTRTDDKLADPKEAVNTVKQRRLIRAARWFLHQRRWTDRPARFDVVAITLPKAGVPRIEYVRDAFCPRDAP